MLNLSKVSFKVSSGSGELMEIDISSVFTERWLLGASLVLSLRICLLRKALDAGFQRSALPSAPYPQILICCC